MWVYIFIFAALVASALFSDVTNDAAVVTANAEVTTVASSMMIYNGYVESYAKSNPAASGSIPDAALGLPYWFVKQPGINNYVAGGRGYVFTSRAEPGLAAQLAAAANFSVYAGFNKGGVLVSPILSPAATSGIAIPAAIPSGSVVIVGL